MTSRVEKYTVVVRGTRTFLDIVLCVDVSLELDALQDTLISVINIFQARIAAQGDGFIEPDPWYAPIVEGRDCGLAFKSRRTGQSTLTYQVAIDALLGLFNFYRTMQLYKGTLSIIVDKRLAEPDWDVGTMVVGPFDL